MTPAAPGWSRALAGATLRGPCVSRIWPLRWLTLGLVRRLGGSCFSAMAADGTRIEALRVPALDRRGRRTPVLLAHGYLETKEFHLHQARLLSRHGHDVLLVDLRGHGRSRGERTTFGVRERGDLAAVIDAARDRGWVDERVIDIGYSLGAASALQHAACDARVSGVVAMAPFFDMRSAVASFHRTLGSWCLDRDSVLRGFDAVCPRHGFAPGEASTVEAVRRLAIPALFVVGARDRLLPGPVHTDRLVAAHRGAWHRHLTVQRAGHVDLCIRGWPGLNEAMVAFCAEV